MSVTKRRNRLEPLEERRKLFGIGRFGRDFDHLLHGPRPSDPFACFLRLIAVPQPDRRREIFQRHARRWRSRRRASDRAPVAAPAPSAAPRRDRSSCTWRRRRRSHTCSLLPYFPPSRSSGFTPSFTMFGVPHELVIIVSCPRCHQRSYASSCGPRSSSHRPRISNVSGSRMNVPPGPLPSGAPSALRKMPSGPQCTVCGAA